MAAAPGRVEPPACVPPCWAGSAATIGLLRSVVEEVAAKWASLRLGAGGGGGFEPGFNPGSNSFPFKMEFEPGVNLGSNLLKGLSCSGVL